MPEDQVVETTAPSEETPTAPAGDTPGDTTQSPEEKPEPYFVAETKEDFEANYGKVRTEARKTIANSYGYESVAEFDQAMQRMQQQQDKEKTASEKLTTEKQRAKTLESELRSLKLDREIEKQALAFGADPAQLEAVAKLRDSSPEEFDAEGNLNPKAVKDSVKAVVQKYPALVKGGSTTIGGGGTPATAAAGARSADEKAQDALQKGDVQSSISLKMNKILGALSAGTGL